MAKKQEEAPAPEMPESPAEPEQFEEPKNVDPDKKAPTPFDLQFPLADQDE